MTNKRRWAGIVVGAGALCLWPLAARAGLTEREKALWGASAQAPTTFVVPAARAAAVLDQAQALIGGWATMDRYMWPMPVRTRTAHLVETGEPTALNGVGFRVLDTPTGGGDVITVTTSAYTAKIFQASEQRRDSEKRAHLLAYLLEQYAGVPTSDSPTPAPAPGSRALAPDPFAAPLQRLRDQLTGGQYDAALGTLDDLRAAVARARAAGK